VVGLASVSSSSRHRDVLGPPIGVGPLDQDFAGAEDKVPMGEMNGEASQLVMPGQHIAQFFEAFKIVVVERRSFMQVRQSAPLHWLNGKRHSGTPRWRYLRSRKSVRGKLSKTGRWRQRKS
jgi:hypothetical protein